MTAGRSREHPRLVLRLYVAGKGPNSLRAIANLEGIRRDHLHGNSDIAIIDVLSEPLEALSKGIRVTPTLLRVSPGPVTRIVGDLSDTPTVLSSLGLNAAGQAP